MTTPTPDEPMDQPEEANDVSQLGCDCMDVLASIYEGVRSTMSFEASGDSS